MKKIILALGVGSALLFSCKEKPPYIELTATQSTATKVDTTYVLATVPAADPHNILFENFTGASCSNCPAAHDILNTLESSNPGRINIVSLYIKDFSQTTPPPGAKFDFRTDGATSIMTSVYTVVAAMPCAGIDRLQLGDISYGSDYLIGRDVWNTIVPTRLSVVDSVNLALTSTYNAATRNATVNFKVTYLQPVATLQNFSIVVVEDSFVDKQEYPTYVDTAYHFNDIYRGSVTSGSLGEPILSTLAVKEKGRVYDVTYTYKVDAAWNPAHCKLVGFVHTGSANGGKIVYQSTQAKLVN